MQTIVEPKQHVDKLWGKQKVRRDKTYRLMKYVIRVDHESKVLLHNVVTGQLVVLDQDAVEMVNKLPKNYDPIMEQLVAEHYLVPDDYDEHQQVVNLRRVLRKLDDAQGDKPILHYTILPTTACNARCYYCFEQGIQPVFMSEKTADDLVEFIATHCGSEKTVGITWFGGEPTVATNRIDQICQGLIDRDISFRSKMTSNGYLFDPEMVKKAKKLWHLYGVQVCVDGTEESYNKAKAYVNAQNPYQRVMRNIGLLLDEGIAVGLRMNFDLGNYHEFSEVVDEALARFNNRQLLSMSAHPIIGTYADWDGRILHADDEWFSEKIVELNGVATSKGVSPPLPQLPFLNGDSCSASTGLSVTVRPDGGISRCAELFCDEDLIGTVSDGITNRDVDNSWKEIADYDMCVNCMLFPHCLRLANCPNKTYCHKYQIYLKHYSEGIGRLFTRYQLECEGGFSNANAGT